MERYAVPVHQNLLLRDQEAAVAITRGDLLMRFCNQCGFVYNAAFDLGKLSYNQGYDNTQTYSPYFRQYIDDVIHYLVEDQGIRASNIVEVGCGKGLFLRKLVEFPSANNRGVGFDPSYVGPLEDLDGKLRFELRFYDEQAAGTPADVIICRHVIEHVPDPVRLLRSIRKALSMQPHARVYFETPCVAWILQAQIIWDFYYEHCSLFTLQSLSAAFQVAGFVVKAVRHIFGEQYLWLEAELASGEVVQPDFQPAGISKLARNFKVAERDLIASWRRKIGEQARRGKVALWGAGAKGVTLANLVDPERNLLDCLVDLNPRKQGGFLPGTGHPIVGYTQLPDRHVRSAFLLNTNYRVEVLELLKNDRIALHLIDA